MKTGRWRQLSKSSEKIQKLTSACHGQTLAMFAVMIATLFAFMGLILDGGRIYFDKRRMQAAADAGAMAGAHELWRRNTDMATQLRPAAVNDTGLNGFTDSNATITVNNGPATGPFAGDPEFVEVIIEQDVPLTFMRVVSWTQATVRARAVAGLVEYSDACVLAMDREEKSALKTNGNPTLIANCGIMSDSAADDGLNGVGASIVVGDWIGVTGNYDGGGSFTPLPEVGVPPMMDPLGYMGPPDYSTAPDAVWDGATETYSCPTGTCIFNDTAKITNGDVTFEPGTYVLMKGMQITGGNVTGIGVTFYAADNGGKNHIDIGGNGVVTFEAPTSGPMKGMLFYGDRGLADLNPGNKIGRGSSNSYFKGAIYFPSQHVDWAGNPQAISAWSMIIANTINISGTSDVQQISGPAPGQGPRITKATLVE